MKCKNCGKEIPDDAKFCGFCGTPVEIEADQVEKEAPVKEAPVEETPVEETLAEAPKAESLDAPKAESEEVPPSLGSQMGEKLKETAAGKAVLGDDGKLDKEDFTRMGNAAKEGAAHAYHSIKWEEFKTFLAIFKDPFGDHALAVVPSIVVTVAAILVNWFAVSTFLDALVITAVAYTALMLVLYINKSEEHFDGKKAYGRASQLMTLPVISMFVMCLFAISMKSTMNGTSATAFGMSTYLYTLRSSLAIVLLFLLFSMVTYTMGMIEAGKKMNKYILAVIITAVFSFCIFYLVSQALNSLYSMM